MYSNPIIGPVSSVRNHLDGQNPKEAKWTFISNSFILRCCCLKKLKELGLAFFVLWTWSQKIFILCPFSKSFMSIFYILRYHWLSEVLLCNHVSRTTRSSPNKHVTCDPSSFNNNSISYRSIRPIIRSATTTRRGGRKLTFGNDRYNVKHKKPHDPCLK